MKCNQHITLWSLLLKPWFEFNADKIFPSFFLTHYWICYTQNIIQTEFPYFWYETCWIYALQQKCTFRIFALGTWVTLMCSLELLEKRLLRARSLDPRLAVCLVDNSTIWDVVTAIGTRTTCLPPPSPKVKSHLNSITVLLNISGSSMWLWPLVCWTEGKSMKRSTEEKIGLKRE